MNFIFDGCFFGTNNIYIQNNNTFILPERTPFADVTEKMKNFFNIQKNKPFNAFSKNFNDNSNEAKEFQFLKKKSFGEYMNSTKENEEKIESKESINKSSKYLNNLYKKQNSIISNLDEDVDESDKENLSFINKKDSDSDNESIDINQIYPKKNQLHNANYIKVDFLKIGSKMYDFYYLFNLYFNYTYDTMKELKQNFVDYDTLKRYIASIIRYN